MDGRTNSIDVHERIKRGYSFRSLFSLYWSFRVKDVNMTGECRQQTKEKNSTFLGKVVGRHGVFGPRTFHHQSDQTAPDELVHSILIIHKRQILFL